MIIRKVNLPFSESRGELAVLSSKTVLAHTPLRALDLFAGIGGWNLALSALGRSRAAWPGP